MFVNVNTGEGMTWENWWEGEPNNWGTGEDCALNKDLGSNDVTCDSQYCSMCKLMESPKLQMKGVCQDSEVDTYYILQLGKGQLIRKELLGYKQTKMVWSAEDRRWNIVNLVTDNILAYTDATEDIPIGTKRWMFTNRSCTEPGQHWRQLGLQQISKQPGQFCCDDGLCIHSEHRCDTNQHCRDTSDEKSCDMIRHIKDQYNDKIPPSQMIKRGKEISFSQTSIDTSVNILDIREINEAASLISLMFVVFLEWTDSSVMYNFLKKNENKNVLDTDKKTIWLPKLKFIILRDLSMPIVMDEIVTIRRSGNAVMSAGMQSLHSNETYLGIENPITMRTLYQGDFVCSFEGIVSFPFDSHQCSVEFYISGVANNMTDLIPGNLTDQGPSSVGQYRVRGWGMTARTLQGGNSGIRLTVQLGRNLVSILLVTYLPTVLMNLVNQVTNYIQSEGNYELVISVNITCMMVLASVYLSVSGSLPPTAAIKTVEIWLLFNLTYPVSGHHCQHHNSGKITVINTNNNKADTSGCKIQTI